MKNLLGKMRTGFNWFLDFQAWVAAGMIAVMLLIICADVVMRYVFDNPLSWTIEISELFLVWIVSLGMAWLLREDGHVRVDIVVTRFSPRRQLLIDLVTSTVSAVMLLIVTWHGFNRTVEIVARGTTEAYSVLYLPAGLFLVPLCCGCFLFAVQFIVRACDALTKTLQTGAGK